MSRPQTRWTVVFRNGFISHRYTGFTRRGAIEEVLAQYASLRAKLYPTHSNAQFWRIMKRKRGFTVRRITLKVVR